MVMKPIYDYSDEELDDIVQDTSLNLQRGDISWWDLKDGQIVIFYPSDPWSSERPWICQVHYDDEGNMALPYVRKSKNRPGTWTHELKRTGIYEGMEQYHREFRTYESGSDFGSQIWSNAYPKTWALWNKIVIINWLNINPLEVKS